MIIRRAERAWVRPWAFNRSAEPDAVLFAFLRLSFTDCLPSLLWLISSSFLLHRIAGLGGFHYNHHYYFTSLGPFYPMSTAVTLYHPGRAAIVQVLATYSWRSPSIQEAPLASQLSLRQAVLGIVVCTLA